MPYTPVAPEISEGKMQEIFKMFRDDFELNKKQLAKYLNIPYNTYVLWEKGAIKVQHKTIMLLALSGLRHQLNAKYYDPHI